MGRSVHINHGVLENLSNSIKSVDFQIGLLIGQSSSSGEFLVHWCPTPAPDSGSLPRSFEELSADDVAHHAAQVVRMVPGGLSIRGIYLASVSAHQTSSNSTRTDKIRSLLCSLYRHTVALYSTQIGLKPPETESKMVVLSLCSKTLKYSCQSLICNVTSGALPEDVNVQVDMEQEAWRELEFSYYMDLTLYVAAQQGKEASLHNMLLSELRPWAGRVAAGVVVVEGVVCTDHDTTALANKFPYKGAADTARRLNTHILDSCAGGAESSKAAAAGEVGTVVRIQGTVAGRAAVHPQCSVACAVRAVRSDIVRSVCVRWSLHCDSLLQEEAAPAPTAASAAVLHEPPHRVFLKRQPTEKPGVSVCDYLFPGDGPADAVQSVQELLSISVDVADVEQHLETAPSMVTCSDELGLPASSCSTSDSRYNLSLRPRHLQAAALLALLAILLAYVSLVSTQ